jgi:hypothetical protein
MEENGRIHVPAILPPSKNSGIYWIGGWAEPGRVGVFLGGAIPVVYVLIGIREIRQT